LYFFYAFVAFAIRISIDFLVIGVSFTIDYFSCVRLRKFCLKCICFSVH